LAANPNDATAKAKLAELPNVPTGHYVQQDFAAVAAMRTYLSTQPDGVTELAYFDSLDVPVITNNAGLAEAQVIMVGHRNTATNVMDSFTFDKLKVRVHVDPKAALLTSNVLFGDPTRGRLPNGTIVPCVRTKGAPDTSPNATHLKIQSPALGFFHEIGHINQAHRDPNAYVHDVSTSDPVYQNLEEKREITGPEALMAQALGEPTRTNHSGYYGVDSTGICLPGPVPYGWPFIQVSDATAHTR
jgi:hypothetical protein